MRLSIAPCVHNRAGQLFPSKLPRRACMHLVGESSLLSEISLVQLMRPTSGLVGCCELSSVRSISRRRAHAIYCKEEPGESGSDEAAKLPATATILSCCSPTIANSCSIDIAVSFLPSQLGVLLYLYSYGSICKLFVS